MSNASSKMGLCPHCRGTDGYLNVRHTHWFVCDIHRTCWNPADDLFDWWTETAEKWEGNYQKLKDYETVEPVFERMVIYPVWKWEEINNG